MAQLEGLLQHPTVLTLLTSPASIVIVYSDNGSKLSRCHSPTPFATGRSVAMWPCPRPRVLTHHLVHLLLTRRRARRSSSYRSYIPLPVTIYPSPYPRSGSRLLLVASPDALQPLGSSPAEMCRDALQPLGASPDAPAPCPAHTHLRPAHPCACGRCVHVAAILRSVVQPERVRRLSGGLNGWKRAGFPVDGDARQMFAGRTMDQAQLGMASGGQIR